MFFFLHRFGDWYSSCQVSSTHPYHGASSADDPTIIAFRRTLFFGSEVRLHATELWIEQRTSAHCSKLPLSKSKSNQLQYFLFDHHTILKNRYHMKNEEFKIFSVKYVRNVMRVGLKSLNEELEESLIICDMRRAEEFDRRVGRKPNNAAQY